MQESRADLVFPDMQLLKLTGSQFLKVCGSRCQVALTPAYPE